MTPVSDVMTRGVRSMSPADPVIKAAQAMEALDVGAIPVCDGNRVVGLVTDRDIVVRAVAQGLQAEDTALQDVMSAQACTCHEDDDVDDVLDQMKEMQIRRMPVLDRREQLVGIVALGDLAVKDDIGIAGDALADISEPAEPNRAGQSQASGAAGGGSASGQARQSQG